MKINEIMIGNWVRPAGGGMPLVIVSMHKFANKSDMVELIHPFKKQIHKLAKIEEIEPIPISDAILELNNFSDEDNGYSDIDAGIIHWYHKDRVGALEQPLITHLRSYDTYILVENSNEIHGLKYVHELQNALTAIRQFDFVEHFIVEEIPV